VTSAFSSSFSSFSFFSLQSPPHVVPTSFSSSIPPVVLPCIPDNLQLQYPSSRSPMYTRQPLAPVSPQSSSHVHTCGWGGREAKYFLVLVFVYASLTTGGLCLFCSGYSSSPMLYHRDHMRPFVCPVPVVTVSSGHAHLESVLDEFHGINFNAHASHYTPIYPTHPLGYAWVALFMIYDIFC
jgi:hypothetical protein